MELDASATRFLLALLNAGVSAIGERQLLELVRGAVLWMRGLRKVRND